MKKILIENLIKALLNVALFVMSIYIFSYMFCGIHFFISREELTNDIISKNPIIRIILGISPLIAFGIFLCLRKIAKKMLLISYDKFVIEEKNNTVFVKYIGKCEFVINKALIDIKEYDFQKDVSGNDISFLDKERVFLSFKQYKDKMIATEQSENNIKKNKRLLYELSENSLGIRKANDYEVKELSERIKLNRRTLLIMCIACPCLCMFAALEIKDVFMLKLFSGLSVFFIFVSFVVCSYLTRLRNDKDVTYLIMECTICDKIDYSRKNGHHYKIRCKDINRLYIDDWFVCGWETYTDNKANIVLAKQKNGKVYINSFDKLWSRPSVIVKV